MLKILHITASFSVLKYKLLDLCLGYLVSSALSCKVRRCYEARSSFEKGRRQVPRNHSWTALPEPRPLPPSGTLQPGLSGIALRICPAWAANRPFQSINKNFSISIASSTCSKHTVVACGAAGVAPCPVVAGLEQVMHPHFAPLCTIVPSTPACRPVWVCRFPLEATGPDSRPCGHISCSVMRILLLCQISRPVGAAWQHV